MSCGKAANSILNDYTLSHKQYNYSFSCSSLVDHTRVTLTPIEGAEHDYINANFIDVSTNNSLH